MASRIREVVRRVAGIMRQGTMERRLDDEMRFHIDMLTERYRRSGVASENSDFVDLFRAATERLVELDRVRAACEKQ